MHEEQSKRLFLSKYHSPIVIAAAGLVFTILVLLGLFQFLPSSVDTAVPIGLTALAGIIIAVTKSRAFGIGVILGSVAYVGFLLWIFSSLAGIDMVG